MADTALHDDELWAEFHRGVNMSSRELADWLRTRSAGPQTEPLPARAGTAAGQQVLHILGKRRADLNADDLLVMFRLSRRVHSVPRAYQQAIAASAGRR